MFPSSQEPDHRIPGECVVRTSLVCLDDFAGKRTPTTALLRARKVVGAHEESQGVPLLKFTPKRRCLFSWTCQTGGFLLVSLKVKTAKQGVPTQTETHHF